MTKYSTVAPLIAAAEAFTFAHVDKTALARVWEKREGKLFSRWAPFSRH